MNDDDLLELIPGTIAGVNAHLSKLFRGIKKVDIHNKQIVSVTCPEAEHLKLSKAVEIDESLPHWLKKLEDEIRHTLQQSLEKCCKESDPDISAYPGQVNRANRVRQTPTIIYNSFSINSFKILLLTGRIKFTEQCETWMKKGYTELNNLEQSLEASKTRYKHTENGEDALLAAKARQLVLETVYHIKMVRKISREYVDHMKASWIWKKQVRAYKVVSCMLYFG